MTYPVFAIGFTGLPEFIPALSAPAQQRPIIKTQIVKDISHRDCSTCKNFDGNAYADDCNACSMFYADHWEAKQ